MIRDNEIEAVIAEKQDNMTDCVDALINAALEAAGADNCTVALCQIVSGGGQSELGRIPKFDSKKKIANTINVTPSSTRKNPILWVSIVTLILVILSCITIFLIKGNPFVEPNRPTEKHIGDSIDKDSTEVGQEIIGNKEGNEKNETVKSEGSEKDAEEVIDTNNLKDQKSKKSSAKNKGNIGTPESSKESEKEEELGFTIDETENSKDGSKEEEWTP